MEYRIVGDSLPAVICDLEGGETMITESGAMSWMTPNMKMETTGGGIGKMLGRALSGDTIFQNRYTAEGGKGQIAFSSSFPGCIKAMEVTPGKGMILQKSAFMASTSGVELSMHFKGKVGTGLFGGEGFIMQKVSGTGVVFVEIDGHAEEYTLEAGQSLVVDTGCLAAMEESCTMEIKTVPGVKNMVFGGEGVFNTVVSGPGRVWLQTMPISGVAAVLKPFFPASR